MTRETYLEEIASDLSVLSRQIELLNSVNFYNINIAAEDFYAGLLNLIMGTQLKNINAVEKNAPAIDLADEGNKLAVQVTSQSDRGKIQHTIDEFISSRQYETFDRLIVLILTVKKDYHKDFETQNRFHFDKSDDIWDTKTLMEKIKSLDTDKLGLIRDFLKRELKLEPGAAGNTNPNEVDTIIDLIEFITGHKGAKQKIDALTDPEYKIYKRFQTFANRLTELYQNLFIQYGGALSEVERLLEMDEAQHLITVYYLQDLSMGYLDQYGNDPIAALNGLVDFFAGELSKNGKNYDQMAIKFYLISEVIRCNVFPNEGGEYDGGEF